MEEPHKQKRRKWIRYEREHSNLLWHTDWHEIKDERWTGQRLICYEDDASRFIAGYEKYPTLTPSYSVEVLDGAIKKHGKPKSMPSDHGSTFYAVESQAREKGLTEFERCPLKEQDQAHHGEGRPPADEREDREVLRGLREEGQVLLVD